MLFFIKKFISQFLMPISGITLIYSLGWILVQFTAYKKTGRIMLGSAVFGFLLFGYGVGAEKYLYQLERTYRSVEISTNHLEYYRGASIMVLGQGFPKNSDLPLRHQTSSSFQMRLQEGIRLYKMIPDAQLFVSLAGPTDDALKEKYLTSYAQDHGLVRERMYLVSKARDTTDEASLVLDRVKTKYFFVATSASHLPRAMKIFSKELAHRNIAHRIMQPQDMEKPFASNELFMIPAPCDYLTVAKGHYSFRIWALPLPTLEGFNMVQHAWYEWLGNTFEDLK